MELKNKCFMKLRDNAIIPTRATKYSAGYDFSIPADGNREFLISPGEVLKVKTGIAVILNDNEYLAIHIRSSLGIKKHLMLANYACQCYWGYRLGLLRKPGQQGRNHHRPVQLWEYGSSAKGRRESRTRYYLYIW